MTLYHNRPHVEDIRNMKKRGEKLSMLYVTTLEEAAAASEAGIDILSIEARFWSPEMRAAAGNCFVQLGLPYGPFGPAGSKLVTAEDYLRSAFEYQATGADCFYCAASYDILADMAANHLPVVAHVGLVPSYITWTGWRAVGKTAGEAIALYEHMKKLEEIGVFGVELEVVPEVLAKFLSNNSPLLLFGMGAGIHADAQYLFAEDVCGYGKNHAPRHSKMYCNLAPMLEEMQKERIMAFKAFKAEISSGEFPAPEHSIPISDQEIDSFLKAVKGRS